MKPRIGLPRSFEKFWDILTYPAFGPSFWSNPIRVGVYFREFPLPMWDATIKRGCPKGCDDLFYGQNMLPSEIMKQELLHVSHGHEGYKALINGLSATRKVLECLFDVNGIEVPNGIVVSDIIKRFAPFDEKARPFKDPP